MSEEEPLLAEDSGRSTEEDSEIGLGSIPYSRIQSQCLPFEDPTLKRLVPGCGITVSIQDAYYKDRKCWYTLDLQHGCFKWTLKKRFHDFLYLHQKLQVYRTLLALQFPEIKPPWKVMCRAYWMCHTSEISQKLNFLKFGERRQASHGSRIHRAGRGLKFFAGQKYDFLLLRGPFSECRWIVDGATYFEAIAEVLDKAKEEIYIADWWLTPEIYLKRPTIHGHYWQLDYVLKRKAREGVQIYVLLYKELEVALGINSYHTKKKLKRMHKNIKEKFCGDQKYAFVGGPIGYVGGDYQHRLSDFGELEKKLRVLRHTSIPRKDSAPLQEARSTSSLPELSSEAEMTFKDIKKRLSMEAVMDESHPGAEKLVSNQEKFCFFEWNLHSITLKRASYFQGFSLTTFGQTPHNTGNGSAGLGNGQKISTWHGKDYANFIFKDLYNLHQPYSDNIDRNVTPRMPWHDVGLFVQGKIARDIARHFILRWNHAKDAICLYTHKCEMCPRDLSIVPFAKKPIQLRAKCLFFHLGRLIGTFFRAENQVLRSLSHWSGGISETERSIQEAYIGIIQGSKHFIYIENQFFVTQPSGEHNIFNGIADALYNRIIKAHRNKVQFHVYVVLPLLPAFEGELGTGTGTCIQAVSYWIYKSICRGPTSLYDRLSRHIQDPSLYISFCGLRTHGLLNYKLVTELVYVHSKLLIADDQVAIIGSANINDRSLLGRRDSEIAVVIRDNHFLDKEEGRPHEAGKFCYSLRNAIFREHLGLMTSSQFNVELRDPSSQKFSKDIWTKTAISNTEIYEEVFHCIPTDSAHTFRELKVLQCMPSFASTNPEEAMKKLKEIRGYLVLFPFFFLCDEKLALTLSTKERYLPVSVWT
ncbi:Phospholipase D1 like protein [Argiope bruennichi]|uniref:Phospholipase n=1 Tax=Argiope bruennichi TaxID=94029 RepID=A0A8T0FRC7_ARGBR|nr:Phospholipase D1 like protein [Argiope bruennichi]